MNITQIMSARARSNLRGQMHKVAAIMAKNDGIFLTRDEVTIKEAAYLLGFRFWKNYLEKRAMLDGIVHAMRIQANR